MPLTDADIEEYLRTRSDFELELFVYRTLLERGCETTHGGTYIDSLTGKARQYDVRALFELHRGHPQLPICRLAMAIECKSLSPEAPLLVSRVPRPPQDSYHELIHSSRPPDQRTKLARVLRQEPSGLYREERQTGKRTAQVSRTNSGGFKDDDRDPYEKWSQALASVADLVKSAGGAASDRQQALSLILPILVVADGTLWAADYSQDGARIGAARMADAIELFVDRTYTWHQPPPLPPPPTYRIGHLHIYTSSGFSKFLRQLFGGDRLSSQIFEFGLQQLLRQ